MDILWIFYGDVRIFYVDIMAYHIGDIPYRSFTQQTPFFSPRQLLRARPRGFELPGSAAASRGQ